MRNQVIPSGNVVQEFMLGGVTVRICDDYCQNQTKEETDAVLARIAAIALIALQPQLHSGELEAREPDNNGDTCTKE